ncbi:phosphonoacetaldehyde hydrolase [Candidatus Persebacteraceae bacterium Df01]|uniref:Phosphonoacetaldehyde hydrolase n=1 Tax=Candidatus Doriopsillibacter californiensis TaxID=2970740 RepID=A0ABT7QMH5_9GAMM|nr:phosphonoacetaldehyde hydrolase [Candidatus Persebacteraceae bacterium Df01]
MNNPTHRKKYRGPVKAAIMDWSGTLVDAYVVAPSVVFVEIFKKYGVSVTMSEVRGPMGLRKDAHIQKLLEDPEIRARWMTSHGKPPNADDVAAMYIDFIPLQLKCLAQYGTLLPGVAGAANVLRHNYSMKLGATTGFTRAMIDVLLVETEKQGLHLDATVGGDEVINGSRPQPFMLYRNLDLMNISPIQAVMKVDDSIAGIDEGLAAGCWTVGVSRYSNYMNIDSVADAEKVSAKELDSQHSHAKKLLLQAGAHYVVDSVAELPQVVEDINVRLKRGEQA